MNHERRIVQPQLVKFLRERRRLGADQLATRMGVHRTWVRRLEDGELGDSAEIAFWRVEKLASGLVVDLDAIAPMRKPQWKAANWLQPDTTEAIFQEFQDSSICFMIGRSAESYLLPHGLNELLDQSSISRLQAMPSLIPAWRDWAQTYRAEQLRARSHDYLQIAILPETFFAHRFAGNAPWIEEFVSKLASHREHTTIVLLDSSRWQHATERLSMLLHADAWDKVVLLDKVLAIVRPRRSWYQMTYHPPTLASLHNLFTDIIKHDFGTSYTASSLRLAFDRTIKAVRRLSRNSA